MKMIQKIVTASIIFGCAHAQATDLRTYHARGVFLWNYLEVHLQQVQGQCPKNSQRAVAVNGLAPMVLVGCWKRVPTYRVAVTLEDGTKISRHMRDIAWCTPMIPCKSLLKSHPTNTNEHVR